MVWNTGEKIGVDVYFVVIKGDDVNTKLKLIIKKQGGDLFPAEDGGI